ncbi:DUF6541 family protein [Microbacterium sp. P05]|uniref:DUF6541 family protein n=1 Tax=Microbacterium sp. P05 TaxID=3366948 RepID=UPI003746DC77
MSWWAAAPAVAAAVGMLLLPGAIVVLPLRMGLVARAAVSGLTSIALIGFAGILFALGGIGFAAWQPFVLALAAGGLVAVIDRRRTRLAGPAEQSRWRWILLTWAVTAVLIGVVAFSGVASPDRVSQTYDNVFHMSAIAAILDGADASSLTLRTLIETAQVTGFYPAGWHSLVVSVVQLSGVVPTVAANAAWLAVAVAVWVPGAAWLAQVILRQFEPGLVAVVSIPLAAAFGSMPYSLLSWGTLYPTFLATSLLPAAVAVPILAGRALGGAQGLRRWRVLVLGSSAIVGTVSALTFAQPRVLVSWALLLSPLLIGAVVGLLRASLRAGGAARRRAIWSIASGGGVLALAAAAGFAYLVFGLGLFERPLDQRLGGPQAAATQSVAEGIWQGLAQAWPTGVGGVAAAPAVLLAGFVLVGIGAALRSRGVRWVVVSYVAVVVLFALAAGSDDVVSKVLTALWYKDRYRLSSVAPVLGVTLAALGILVAGRWLQRRARWAERRGVLLPVAASWLVTSTAVVTLVLTGATGAIATVFHLPPARAQTEIVSQAQIDFMARLGDVVPADQRVLGDPWDGSAWTQLFGDREPVFPHVNGQWDAARLTLAYGLDTIETDPAVCAALDELRVRYVLYSPHEFAGGDPAGNHFPAPHRAVEAGLFTEVASDGDSILYRIDQCAPMQ